MLYVHTYITCNQSAQYVLDLQKDSVSECIVHVAISICSNYKPVAARTHFIVASSPSNTQAIRTCYTIQLKCVALPVKLYVHVVPHSLMCAKKNNLMT